MEHQDPYFEIASPFGEDSIHVLKGNDPITIGRLEENGICLPDPDQNISRYHCLVKLINNHWQLEDPGSANGTYVERIGLEMPIDARCCEGVILKEDDVVLILSHFQEEQPIFWRFTFHDPGRTIPKKGYEAPYHLEYDLQNQILVKANRYEQTKIKLTGQEQAVISYMAKCNYEQQVASVVCTYRELMEAIWTDNFGHHANEINRLVWGIRKKIEVDSGEPKFLCSVRGVGYKLKIKII